MIDWDELMGREGTAVWRTAYRLVRNEADADECFQETFLAAWSYRIARACKIGRRCCSGWRPVERSIGSGNACDENGGRKLRTSHRPKRPTPIVSQEAEAAELEQRTAMGGRSSRPGKPRCFVCTSWGIGVINRLPIS